MSSQRDEIEEQQKKVRRAKVFKEKIRYYKHRVQPPLTDKDICGEELNPTIISKLGSPYEEKLDQPAARKYLLIIIRGLIEHRAMLSLDEANEFLRSIDFDELQSEEAQEIKNILDDLNVEEDNKNDDEEIGFYYPELLKIYIERLNELLTETKVLPSLAYTLNTPITLRTADIYELLSSKVQTVFRWLGVIPDGSSIATVMLTGRTRDGLRQEDYFTIFELLRACNLIEIIDDPSPLPLDADYRWQFRHAFIRFFALRQLMAKQEHEVIRKRCLTYYHDLLRIFILAKYRYEMPATRLATMPYFTRLSAEYSAFTLAVLQMRAARQEDIKNKIRLKYLEKYQNLTLHLETISVVELRPKTLTEKQKDLIKEYEKIREEVEKDPNCPYPLADWFWKYLDYEMNPQYFATPNAFAVLWGRLAIIQTEMHDHNHTININKPLKNLL